MDKVLFAGTDTGYKDIVPGAAPSAGIFTEDLYRRWTAYLDAAPKTIDTYSRSIKQFMLFIREKGIAAPSRADIIAYRDGLRARLKPATVQLYMISVRLFFGWLEQEGIYPNVAMRVKGSRIDSTRHRRDYLTARQAAAVLKGIDRSTITGLRDYAVLVTMLTTGLRTVEISRADIADIRALGGLTVLYIQGKGHDDKDDFVKITEPAEKAVREYLSARVDFSDDAPLFVSHSNRNAGGRMTTRSISRLVKERLIAAGYKSERLTAHSMRHTAATLSLLNGASLEETQQLLRHSNINTTMIYSHALERADNTAEQRITDAIFG